MRTSRARTALAWSAPLLALSLAASCARSTPAPGTPASSSSASSAAPPPVPSAVTTESAAAPSPRCVAQCNAEYEASKTSMCKFCRSHQIGAPADRFEEFDRSCAATCDHEWHACVDACEGRAR